MRRYPPSQLTKGCSSFQAGTPSFLACSFWARNGRERYPSKTRVRRNTVYIEHTVKTLRQQGHRVLDDLMPH